MLQNDFYQIGPNLICVGVALWAVSTIRRAKTYAQKLLLASIPIVLLCGLTLEFIGGHYHIASVNSLITPMFLLFAGLVVVALAFSAKNHASRS